MYCKYCGANICKESIFCSNCGKKLISNEVDSKSRLSNVFANTPKYVLALLWWTLLIFIIGILIYGQDSDFEDTLPLFPVYFGLILLMYTIRYFQNTRNSVVSVDGCVNSNKEKVEYTLSEFADKYGKMQVCRYLSKNGELRSKCTFTSVTEVEFDGNIGELSATEIVENKSVLMIKKIPRSGAFLISCKDGAKIIKCKSSTAPPPLDKILDNNH